MRKIAFLGTILFIMGCSDNNFVDIGELNNIHKSIIPSIDINISTTRDIWNMLKLGEEIQKPDTRSSSDPFTEIREMESSESVVLPELQPHIWIGNILTKNSISDCSYKPLIYPRSPISVALSLPGTSPQKILNPTYSAFTKYIQEQTGKGIFSQNSEFSLTVEQFTSYNELKAAFGSNVDTQSIFWNSSSDSQKKDLLISKATGLYVKFYQTSFKAIMDYPQGEISSIPENMLDSAVYINSISFGRLGILTLESNSTAQYSKEITNRIFNTLFTKSTSNLTVEEKQFLDGCDFKVYLIGGNGNTMVETFTGYKGFAQHIKNGKFNNSEPGTPLFCTFNHAKDNSPVKINFKFNIKKSPLYVELVYKPKNIREWTGGLRTHEKQKVILSGYGDVYLYFYRNRAKIPVIADPSISFGIVAESILSNRTPIKIPGERPVRGYRRMRHDLPVFKVIKNAGYQTSILVLQDFATRLKIEQRSNPSISTVRNGYINLKENKDFVILGHNPIDYSNTNYTQNK